MSRDDTSTYYDAGGIEVFDIIKAKLTGEQFTGFLLGNALKYQLRMMHKTPDQPRRDAEKAANYSKWLEEFMSGLPESESGEELAAFKKPKNWTRSYDHSGQLLNEHALYLPKLKFISGLRNPLFKGDKASPSAGG